MVARRLWFPWKRQKPLPREVPRIPLERTRSQLAPVTAVLLGFASVAVIIRLPRYVERLARHIAAMETAAAARRDERRTQTMFGVKPSDTDRFV